MIVGYTASQTIAITLKDLSEYEDLLTDLLDAGVEYVHGVNFETSELRKHRDEAREMAVEAAKEKATALADQLGQSLGEPAEIVENPQLLWHARGRLVPQRCLDQLARAHKRGSSRRSALRCRIWWRSSSVMSALSSAPIP